MANLFDDIAPEKGGNLFDDIAPESSSMTRRAIGDTGISILKGAIGVPESVVGLADIVTSGRAGKLAEKAGFRPREAKAILEDLYSPEQKRANQAVSEAEGFLPTVRAAVENPSVIGQTVLESAPSMLGGAGVARGVMKVAPRIAPLIAGAIGEGAVTAGQSAEQARQTSPEGKLSLKQSAVSLVSGAATGAIGLAGGKIAKRLGIADIDTMLASGQLNVSQKNLLRRVVEGTATEGILEELPQSAQEQVAQNINSGKPWNEGVAEAAAMGMISGGVMGGGGNVLSGKSSVESDHDLLNPRAERNTPERNELAQSLRAARNQLQGVADERQNADVRDEGNDAEVLSEMQPSNAGGFEGMSGVRDANVTQEDIDLAAQQREVERQQQAVAEVIPEQPEQPKPTPEQEIAGLDDILTTSKDSLLALHQQIASGQLDAEQMKGAKQEIRNLNDRMKSAEKARELLVERLPPTKEEFVAAQGETNDSEIGQGVSLPVGIGQEPGGAVSDQSGSGSKGEISTGTLATGATETTATAEPVKAAEAAPAETVAEVKPVTEADVQKMKRKLVSAQSKGNKAKAKELKSQISAAEKALVEQKKAEAQAAKAAVQAAKAEKAVAKAQQPPPPPKVRNLLSDIKKAGGIPLQSIVRALDVNEVRGAQGKGNRYLKVTGSPGKAMGMDQMGQAMLDAGWPVPTDLNGRVNTDGFAQMLKDAVNGNLPIHPDNAEALAESEWAKYEAEILADLDKEQVAAYDDISELVYEYEFDENAFDEVASFFDDLIAENKNENTERANQEEVGEAATREETGSDRGTEEVARTEPAKAEATDDAGGLKQTIAVEGDKKAPTIGGVQKQGGRKVGTGELLDNFTPDPQIAMFSLSKPSPFFSKAEELVNAKMDNKMPVIQLLNMLKKNGATDAEIDNALGGIRDKGGIVSKAEVLDELKANSVEFQDVVLGEDSRPPDITAVRIKDAPNAPVWARDYSPDQWLVSRNGEPIYVANEDTRTAEQAVMEYTPENDDGYDASGDTFFSQYTETGAVEGSYREMFVTAPKSEGLYDSIKGDYHEWQDGHAQYSDIQNPVVRIRFNEREGSPLNVNPAVRIQKIDAIRESLKNLAGGKAAFQSAFNGVEGVVESAVNHDQVRQKVISLIPVNVVNKLKALQLSPQDLFSGKTVSANDASLLLDSRADIVAGVKSALEKTGAAMRTEIMRHSLAGLDGDVLPALRASDLNRDEVRMILSPEFVDSGHMGEKSTSLSSTRDRTTLPITGRFSVENVSTNLARDMRHDTGSLEDVIKKHGELVKHKQGINARAKILMVEEIQGPSDTNQQKMPDYLRKRIYDIGVKRVLAYAKENGFDGVAWTTGDMQAKRYDLSKHLDSIGYADNGDGTFGLSMMKDGKEVHSIDSATPEELDQWVGKEVAQKIVNGEGVERDGYTELSGLDLKIGGKGLMKLYDVTLPALFKKHGKEGVGGTAIQTGYDVEGGGFRVEVDGEFQDVATRAEADDIAERTGGKVTSLGATIQVPYVPVTQNTPASYAKYSDKGQKSGLLNVIVKKELSPLINRLKDAYSVEVVQSERELRPELQEQIKSENVAGQVEGLYDPKSNKVILVADNLKNLTRAEEVLKHELVHKGIASVFGNRLNIYLDMIKAERGLNSRRAAEEFIAEHGEKYAGQGAVKRFIAAARQMLRDMGFKVKFSDTDIISIAGKSIAATEKAIAIHSDGTRFAAGNKDSALDRRIELMRELDKVKQELFGGTSERVVNVKSVSAEAQQEVAGRYEDTRGDQARELFSAPAYGNEALRLGIAARDLFDGIKSGATTKPEAITSFAQDLNAIAKESPESKQAILDTAAALRALGHEIPTTIDRSFSAHLLEAIDEEYNYLRDTAMFSLKDRAKESDLPTTKESGKIPVKEVTDHDGYMREAERLESVYATFYPDRYSFKAVWPEAAGRDAATAIGRAFGKRVVFIEASTGKDLPFEGVTIDSDTIFIAAKSVDPYVVSVGHELIHTIRRDSPETYNKLLKILIPEIRNFPEYFDRLNAAQSDAKIKTSDISKAVEELIAEFVGDRMTDKTFWNRLSIKSPTVFERVVSLLNNLWTELAQYVRVSDPYFKNIQKAQMLAADVLAEYANRKGVSVDQITSGIDFSLRDRAKAIKEAIGEKTMKEHAHAVLDRVRNVLDNPGGLGTLGNWKEYLAKRYKTLGTLSEIKDFTHDISKTFGKASESDRKAIFNYLTTKDADASTISTHLREESIKMKQMIEDIGDKLVAYGVLPQEVIDANRGEYLPTVYLKHILGKETFQAAGSGKKLDLSYTKKKRLREDLKKQGLSEEEIDLFMRTQMGEIKDPAYLLAKAFSIPSRDMAIIDWLAQVSRKSEWVLPKSLVEWTHSDSPTRKVGSIEYKKNDDGTHDLKITKVKTVETKHTSTAADLAKLLGNDKLADYIATGKGKQQYRKEEVNGKVVLKPTPWKQVGHIQYKVSNGTYELKIKERVKKVDELKGVKDLVGLVGEKKANQIMNDEGKALGGRMVTPFWLMAEAKRIEEMKPHLPESDRAEAQDVADRMKAKAREALEGVTVGKLPDDYRQMPDTPKYGALRGLIVRKEIFNDLVGNINVTIGEKSLPEKILGTGGTVSKLTGMWKWAKVAANPPAQVRNIVSNMVLLNLSGVPFYRVPIRVSQAIKEIKNNGRHWQIAKKYGVKEATFSNTEMARIESDLIDMEARNAGKLSWAQAKSLGAKFVNLTGDAYQFMEAVGKTAKIIDEMESGKSAQDAAMEAHKWLFDYSLVSPGVKYMRNAPIGIPFITFMTKILPRLAEVAVTKPWRFTPYVAMAYGLQSLVAGMIGVDDDDLDKLKQALPKWIHDKQHVYFLPYKDDAGRWQAVDLGYFFPWTQWTEIAQNVYEGDVKGILQQSGILGGPLPDLITAIKTNIDPFTQRPVVDKYADPPEQLAQIMGYLYQMAAPPWLTQRGTAGKIYSALSSEIDKQGQPKSTGKQAALSIAGINLYAYDPALTRQQNIKRMDFEISEVQRQARSALQDRNLTPGEREKIREKFLGRIQKMNREKIKYAAGSMPKDQSLLQR